LAFFGVDSVDWRQTSPAGDKEVNAYITADKVGGWTGGSSVTAHEAAALSSLEETTVYDRERLTGLFREEWMQPREEPWVWDATARFHLFQQVCSSGHHLNPYKLAHFYAGTFSNTVGILKSVGCKVTYTAAAHCVKESKEEHEKLGVPYNYPHLTEPALWERYVRGYLEADVLICPSVHSANVMRKFGAKNRIEIIPHGCHIPPEPSKAETKQFTVGYLGTAGAPDKGLVYLLQAWRRLNLPNAQLVIAGADSQTPWVQSLVQHFGLSSNFSNIMLKGWVQNVSDFYNSIDVYVQPSVSEGFGLEVLEAMAHGRVTISSTGAGAADVLPQHAVVQPRDIAGLERRLGYWHGVYVSNKQYMVKEGLEMRSLAEGYSWDKIRERYVQLWRSLLCK
jgi:glycosyltransferase involved in cell wall biosynthesis